MSEQIEAEADGSGTAQTNAIDVEIDDVIGADVNGECHNPANWDPCPRCRKDVRVDMDICWSCGTDMDADPADVRPGFDIDLGTSESEA